MKRRQFLSGLAAPMGIAWSFGAGARWGRRVELRGARSAPLPGQVRAAGPDYGPSDWVEPDHSEPEGTHYKTFHSRTINADVSYLIYLPPDYDRQQSARYPVVYDLHGSFVTQTEGAQTVRRVAKAIENGRVLPMIVVLVNGLRGNTMYCDSRDGKYPLESVIIKDLIPHVDATYRTIASREGRAVDGFSMGGFGAAHLGFKYPELFSVVSIMAPALLGPGMKSPPFASAWSRLFPLAMGSDIDYFRANDPFTLIEKNADALRDRTLIRLVAHFEDQYWLAPRCEELHDLLVQHRIPHAFYFLTNVKSHNRDQLWDSIGDSAFSYFSSSLPRVRYSPLSSRP